jgi:hypothetical protein
MKGVLTAALVIAFLMFAIKDGRILRAAGLTGGCAAVAAPSGESGDWQRCTAGKLEGAPNLSRSGCVAVVTKGKTEYWRCPGSIESKPGT